MSDQGIPGNPPAGGGGGNPPPPNDGNPPPAAERPAYVPEVHWDATKGALNHETFGAHYSELATFKQQHDERIAALPKSPDDYKIEIKLPDTVKVPEGVDLKVDDKDPRLPLVRAFAHKHQLSPDALNELAALDAQMKIEAHNAEMARIAEADKTLGANAKDRKDAVSNWLKGLRERNEITAEEHKDALELATYASTITLFEKLMAKAAGTVPGANDGNPPQPPKQADAPMEQRWYGPTQQKVS